MPVKKPRKPGKILIEKDEFKASPFVVDLNKAAKPEAKPSKKDEFKNFFENLDEQELKEKTQSLLKNKTDSLIKFFKFLAFLSLLKRSGKLIIGLGKLFYKFCYGIGWLAAVLLQLTIFLPVALIRSIHKIFQKPLQLYKRFFKREEKPKFAWLKINKPAFFKRKEETNEHKFKFPFGFRSDDVAKPRLNRVNPVITFVLILVILILPFKLLSYYSSIENIKGDVLGAGADALSNLIAAGSSAKKMDFKDASQDFSKAGTNFLEAQSQLNQINGFLLQLASVAPSKNLRLASNSKNILAAGQDASELGQNLTLAVNALLENKDQNRDMVKMLNDFTGYGKASIGNAKALNDHLSKINFEDLPDQYQAQFIAMRDKAVFLERSLAEFIELVDKLKIFLGIDRDKRYLLIFQNNSELRATGGFFGSFALVDFSKGKIKNIETPPGGSYDTEAGLRERIIAPQPLQMLNPLWHFWDANWWPDWPTSANKIMWFYEKSQGPTVDGVISLTPTVLEELLKVTGPIDMTKDYGVVIDANNFWQVTQQFSEQKPEQTKQPKKIIGDLMNQIIAELPKRFNRQVLFGIVNALETSLSEKQILLYFNDEDLQAAVDKYGWNGRIKNTDYDYLSIINSNIGGGKSDRKVEQRVRHTAQVMADGSIIDELQIQRTHTGIKNEAFSGIRNVDWMRIYVPAGSELLEAKGFSDPEKAYFGQPDPSWQHDPGLKAEEDEAKIDPNSGTKIYSEADKTVFANWTMIDPGETANLYIKYKLPFKLNKQEIKPKTGWWEKILELLSSSQKPLSPYALLVQKQAGAQTNDFHSELKLSDESNYNLLWQYPSKDQVDSPQHFIVSNEGWTINDNLNTDKYWAIVLENN